VARRILLPALRGLETKNLGYGFEHPAAWFNQMTAAARRAWPIDRAVAEGIERTVWVFKAVNSISSHAARQPVQVLDGDGEPVDGHPLAELLNTGKVNPLETARQFRKRLSAQILLSPFGAFVEVTRNRRGVPVRLDLLPPGRTRPVPAATGANLLSHFETITPTGTRVPIDPENVLWFRDPHPTDPFRGITPMEAAGMSVDLDYLSKLYNVIFLRNDGRPSTVVGVEGRLSPDEAERIQRAFGQGPLESGKVYVVNGKISLQDLGARPRDMSYSEMSARAKEEVLAAFGVGETVLGNASGRTFDNADAELFQFWSITMVAHMDIIATGFEPLLEPGETLWHDTSDIEVLRRAEEARRREAREEVAAGLLSIDEYRQIAGHEPIDNPHTRALWMTQGKSPIPTREEDAVPLGVALPTDDTAAPGEPPAEPPAEQPEGEGVPGVVESPADGTSDGATPEPDTFDPSDQATRDAFTVLQGVIDETFQTKAIDPADPEAQAEEDLREQLAALTRRLVERTAARLNSPKTRKGTRHFEPEPAYEVDTRVGDAPLDAERIADAEQWRQEAEDTLGPLVAAAAAAAILALGIPGLPGLPGMPGIPGVSLPRTAGRLAAAALRPRRTTTPAAPGVAPAAPPGGDDNSPDAVAARIRQAAAEAAHHATRWLADQFAQAAAKLGELIAAGDRDGRTVAEITATLRSQTPTLERWAEHVANRITVHTVHAVQVAAARILVAAGGMATAVWTTMLDDRVRPTHAAAHGQARPAGEKFQVGKARLRWPRDIEGPPEEVINCRCRLRWMISPPWSSAA